ncbi:hypothetical protein [Noviherbaspirillum sp.]|uniref:hypothetical protein n=1 Tax=Noviherbaspirillum sp. TaxID=1926288 RepID=UPI002B4631EE|nr:hypothetical protein [Noviherbaspirillum sp.]
MWTTRLRFGGIIMDQKTGSSGQAAFHAGRRSMEALKSTGGMPLPSAFLEGKL